MGKEYKLIVTGGRGFDDYDLLSDTLFQVAEEAGDKYAISIVSGMTQGADMLGRQFAFTHEVTCYEFPADLSYGKGAGFVRNQRMAEFADGLLAFWDGESKGTAHMIKTMQQLGKRVHVVNYKPFKAVFNMKDEPQCPAESMVLNRKVSGIPPGAVYIGRGSRWGNPFVMSSEADRQYVVEQHAAYLEKQITSGEVTLQDLAALHGKKLVCYCAPKACHGDILQRKALWAFEQLNATEGPADIPPWEGPDELARNIFVFGSNLAGRHGAGAALYARQNHGAILGQGIGLQGQSYGIPTKDASLNTLPLDTIQKHVATFLAFAAEHPEMTFEVTRVGCGLAGYMDAQIAPMFKNAPINCRLPNGW